MAEFSKTQMDIAKIETVTGNNAVTAIGFIHRIVGYNSVTRFSIKDTGQGIDNKAIDTVTPPHVKDTKSQGFGLGLNIVSRLCRRFGWELKIESKTDVGTHVMIFWNDE